jgi:FAD:protein FMN transferase
VAIVTLDGATMGTTWRVKLAAGAGVDPAALDTAITARLDGLVAEMSHWDAGSLLAGFNRAPAGSWAALPPDFATVIGAALDVAEMSEGAFDPAIGALVDIHGFGPLGPMPPPTDAAIDRALACSGWRKLAYDRSARRLRQPGGLRLDLSGIAKGYAVDAVAALLATRGIRHALVEIGGELAGRGIRPDGQPWWVDLEAPAEADLPPFRVALHALGVATSGTYVRGAHEIDPATGRPAAHGVAAVSVLHGSTMLADAWASALAVLGPDKGLAMAACHNLMARIVSHDEHGWRETITPALTALL